MGGCYRIMPKDSYVIIRDCAGCHCKKRFVNTHCFRVNASGSQLDVWLIYQCEKCRHTYNLPILERVSHSSIPADIYQRFLANDRALALKYGNDKSLFEKHHVEIDREGAGYAIEEVGPIGEEGKVIIENPYEMKIRADRVLAEILNVSRKRIKEMMERGVIDCVHHYLGEETVIQYIS